MGKLWLLLLGLFTNAFIFWVMFGYFFPDLFRSTLVIGITLSTHLHRWAIKILSWKWPVKTNNLLMYWRKKSAVSIESTFMGFYQCNWVQIYTSLWSETWQSSLKREWDPQVIGHPVGRWVAEVWEMHRGKVSIGGLASAYCCPGIVFIT